VRVIPVTLNLKMTLREGEALPPPPLNGVGGRGGIPQQAAVAAWTVDQVAAYLEQVGRKCAISLP
jgi:hypothetical protein